jgi:hypothetical protein
MSQLLLNQSMPVALPLKDENLYLYDRKPIQFYSEEISFWSSYYSSIIHKICYFPVEISEHIAQYVVNDTSYTLLSFLFQLVDTQDSRLMEFFGQPMNSDIWEKVVSAFDIEVILWVKASGMGNTVEVNSILLNESTTKNGTCWCFETSWSWGTYDFDHMQNQLRRILCRREHSDKIFFKSEEYSTLTKDANNFIMNPHDYINIVDIEELSDDYEEPIEEDFPPGHFNITNGLSLLNLASRKPTSGHWSFPMDLKSFIYKIITHFCFWGYYIVILYDGHYYTIGKSGWELRLVLDLFDTGKITSSTVTLDDLLNSLYRRATQTHCSPLILLFIVK